MEEESRAHTPSLGFRWDMAPRPKKRMLRAQRCLSSLSEPASLNCPASSGTHVHAVWWEPSRQDTKGGGHSPPGAGAAAG